ncbi:hypothetical protein CGLAMM_02165 [Acetobacteraceae bacterium EV16G]|uniref:DUF2335 domain-containing protein n=1 Tax=Sorlinia euscelidii TaxID=3081148 RepID=A0ABU7U187_9PROT
MEPQSKPSAVKSDAPRYTVSGHLDPNLVGPAIAKESAKSDYGMSFQAEASVRQISSSPYPSADMLKDYVDAGFKELPYQIIDRINREQEHRFTMDNARSAREDHLVKEFCWVQKASVLVTLAVSLTGLISAGVLALLHVNPFLCGTIATASVSAPAAAISLRKLLSSEDEKQR